MSAIIQSRLNELTLKRFDYVCAKLGIKRGTAIKIACLDYIEKYRHLLKKEEHDREQVKSK